MRTSLAFLVVSILVLLELKPLDIQVVSAAVDSYDEWLDHVYKSSSPSDVQPGEYNMGGKKKSHPKHKTHHKQHGRHALEEEEVAINAAAAAITPTKIVVAKDGTGNFKTVQAAVNSVPKSNQNRVIIYIKAGIYR